MGSFANGVARKLSAFASQLQEQALCWPITDRKALGARRRTRDVRVCPWHSLTHDPDATFRIPASPRASACSVVCTE